MRLLNKKFARKTAAAALVLATAATLATGAFAEMCIRDSPRAAGSG